MKNLVSLLLLGVFCLFSFNSCGNSTSSNYTPPPNGMNGSVTEALWVGSNLYVIGDFDSVAGKPVAAIAMWNGASWSGVGSALSPFAQSSVKALATDGANLYIGGNFQSTINSTNLAYVAEWDGHAWSHLPVMSSIGYTGFVNHLAFDQGMLLATDGTYGVWSYNGSDWNELTAGTAGYDSVTSIASSSGSLYLASRNNVWKHFATWSQQGGAFASANGAPAAIKLATSGSDLYGGGDFGQIGQITLTSYGVAKWNGAQWSSVGALAGTTKITAIAVAPDGTIYAAQPGVLMKYSANAWTQVATTMGGFGNQGIIRTIAISATGKVAIGGDFTSVNGGTANHIAFF